MLRAYLPSVCFVVSALLFGVPVGAQWSQWRGDGRDGVAGESPALLESLPDSGIPALWISEPVPGGNNGGWASPLVCQGRVYQFAHSRERRPDVDLAPEKYPALSEQQEASMSQQEVREYESLRRQERLERRRQEFDHIETVYCFDDDSGQLLWKFQRNSVATSFSHSCTPACAGGRLYWHGADRQVVCIDAEAGELVWETQLPVEADGSDIPSSPLVVDDLVVVLVGQLFGLDASTGQLRWSGDAQKTRGTHSSPVLWRRGEGAEAVPIVITNVAAGTTIGVAAESGELLWEVSSQAVRSTPVVVGDRLLTYGHSRGAGLRCFDLSRDPPEELWAFRGAADAGSSPLVVGEYAFVQGEGRLACVDMRTGRGRWQTLLDLNRPRYTSLVAADNKVFYAFDGLLGFSATSERFSGLIAAKADESGLLNTEAFFRERLGMDELERTAEGQQQALRLWQNKISRHGPLSCASPAISQGRLYVRLSQALACYDLRSPLASNSGNGSE